MWNVVCENETENLGFSVIQLNKKINIIGHFIIIDYRLYNRDSVIKEY